MKARIVTTYRKTLEEVKTDHYTQTGMAICAGIYGVLAAVLVFG